ncbi:22093_t:CDS:2, partial [Gigaspora margarita]
MKRRFPNLVGFYQTKEEAYNHAKVIKEEQKVDQCKYKFETQEDNAENILIIGRTSSGKSALANVISNSDEFGESEGEVKYRVVDTVRVADTKLPPKKVLFKLAEAIHSMKEGIKQVFAVIGGRFTQEEIEAFDLLIAIFGKNGTKHTTIIRSRFENFRSFEKCEEDRKVLFKTLENESKKVSNLVNSCKGIIYINNPQLGSNERRQRIDEEDRRDSQKLLLEHLSTCQGNYKMECWDTICVRINDFINARKKWRRDKNIDFLIKKEIKELKNEIIEEVRVQLERQPSSEVEIEARINIPFVANAE